MGSFEVEWVTRKLRVEFRKQTLLAKMSKVRVLVRVQIPLSRLGRNLVPKMLVIGSVPPILVTSVACGVVVRRVVKNFCAGVELVVWVAILVNLDEE